MQSWVLLAQVPSAPCHLNGKQDITVDVFYSCSASSCIYRHVRRVLIIDGISHCKIEETDLIRKFHECLLGRGGHPLLSVCQTSALFLGWMLLKRFNMRLQKSNRKVSLKMNGGLLN